ncbi:hypothetical protein L202_04373, partial [Cryptococcus amylolentus CBS 6039]
MIPKCCASTLALGLLLGSVRLPARCHRQQGTGHAGAPGGEAEHHHNRASVAMSPPTTNVHFRVAVIKKSMDMRTEALGAEAGSSVIRYFTSATSQESSAAPRLDNTPSAPFPARSHGDEVPRSTNDSPALPASDSSINQLFNHARDDESEEEDGAGDDSTVQCGPGSSWNPPIHLLLSARRSAGGNQRPPQRELPHPKLQWQREPSRSAARDDQAVRICPSRPRDDSKAML